VDLGELQRHWDEWGKRDPYFAIISRPDRRGNQWNLEEFLETGMQEIDGILAWLGELGVPYRTGRALDFGCGVGRLTQALARTFSHCDGVDIAPTMIDLARDLNQFGDRVQYRVNDRDDLALFDDGVFDLVCSDIVLQHVAPEYSARYVQEFTRVLAPGGVVVFQLPSHPLAPHERAGGTPSLPDEGFRAEIAVDTPNLTIEAGRIQEIGVRVRNASAVAWPEDRFVHLGDHWRELDGAMLQVDDGRTALARTVEPGETVDLTLDVEAPLNTGSYLLDFDLVIDSVAWFADKGSPITTIDVDVVTRTGPDAEHEPATRPVMETHGIRRANVEAILLAGTVEVLAVRESDRSDGWSDNWYVGVKRDGPVKLRRRFRDRLRGR
jgi:SAM-dependent methyltransferase